MRSIKATKYTYEDSLGGAQAVWGYASPKVTAVYIEIHGNINLKNSCICHNSAQEYIETQTTESFMAIYYSQIMYFVLGIYGYIKQ